MSQSLINDLEQSFKKQFPKGYFSAFMDQGLSGYQINVRCGLIGDLNDVSNKIRPNDPMFHQWLIFLSGDNLEKMEVSYLQGGLDLKPDAGSYLAIKRLKTGFRQFTGDEKKASKAFDKFFVKLRGLVDENNGSLFNREMYKDYI
jgi:hypothetical protein